MGGFALLDPTLNFIPHIPPLTNLRLSNLQRGHFDVLLDGEAINSIYEPPPLELYTKFSLQLYFFIFWGIILLQMLTIFIVDKVWVTNIPVCATLWERLMHASLKSHFPFPYVNWHEAEGNCNDHVKRHKSSSHEILATTAVNLVFNLILLTPLVILCKSQNYIFN